MKDEARRDTAERAGQESATDSADATDQEREATTGDTESTGKAGQELATDCTDGTDQAQELTTERAGQESATDRTDGTDQEREATEEDAEGTEVAEKIVELEAERDRLRAEIARARIEQELVGAATAEQAVNAMQVAALMRDRVRADDDLQPVVVDENGNPAKDEYGQPVTVADAVRAFLEENAHLARAAGPATGSGPGQRHSAGPTALTGRTPAGGGAWPSPGRELIAEALRAGA